jgi:hypothetical protein
MGCKHCHGEHSVERHKERKDLHHVGKQCPGCESAGREEYLAKAKKQALAYLPAHPADAITAMVSMLSKHKDWQDPIARALCADALITRTSSASVAREWIEGWN